MSWSRHPTVREGALVSAHAQVIGPIEIGTKAKVGAAILISLPVCGLRPLRAARSRTSKLPKPIN